jgi:hypothetical protein
MAQATTGFSGPDFAGNAGAEFPLGPASEGLRVIFAHGCGVMATTVITGVRFFPATSSGP